MNDGGIDRLPVTQLEERYNLVKSAIYTRLKALGLKPERVGNKAYVNATQIRLLDDLHHFIQTGGTTAEFLDSRGLTGLEDDSSEELSSELSTGQPDMLKLITGLAAEMASRMQPVDPFRYYEILENAAQKGWILKTSELAQLLELPAAMLQQYGDRFSEAGFVFTQSGFRQGEVAWRVSKPLK
ncbi:hypothetical protein BST81_01260 [Leptolyngbya sp. 'hensonii']|uniref:hypothetical protein n=1 Tax=Leptolyngbya sp. 'hensonii' TaxID=1922337 RepID=UPI00094FE9B6|nr:hypothetical protein [Leptolyngbya sp. 'hensonii']OLP20432.1 hypothetical protein BST81_01260 [Leptolyngbya sp. 'hensonii']